MDNKQWKVMASPASAEYSDAAAKLIKRFETEEKAKAYWRKMAAAHTGDYSRRAWIEGPDD